MHDQEKQNPAGGPALYLTSEALNMKYLFSK